MSTLAQRITDLATRIATECKGLRTLLNGNAVDLSALQTTAKGNLVAALNELHSYTVALIDDNAADTVTDKTYSAAKITDLIGDAINGLTNGAPGALDTLDELSAALGDDANFAATVATGLANRLRFDAAQVLTSGQKAQAKANLDAYGNLEIGDPDTNFVTTFTTGLA